MATVKKPGPAGTKLSKLSFEEALNRLEAIVRSLESGELSLEDALQQFEQGVVLTQTCNEHLDLAEKKIQKLVNAGDGSLVLEPFELDGGESGGTE